MTVQSIAFPKNWKRSHITSWLRNHNYHPIKEDSTVNLLGLEFYHLIEMLFLQQKYYPTIFILS